MTRKFAGGTRFRLFPVYAEGQSETIEVGLPPGAIGAGPSDPTLYVADAAGKARPYDPPDSGPPWDGAVLAPARPDADGHFDRIPFGTPQFLAAHLYGSVRHTLDIWQRYLRRRVTWWDADIFPRMELIPLLDWNNAQSGPGFMETGLWRGDGGQSQPFALNFDVVAHETGHQILFSVVGVPDADAIGVPFLAFHESFSDLVALIGVMHFPTVLERLLTQTQGNLYVLNLVNRIGETSANTQIRLAANLDTMDSVAGIALAPDGTWIDPAGLGRNQHAVAGPLTGAVFDVLAELFQDMLVSRGLLAPEADARGWSRADVDAAFDDLHLRTSRAYRRFAEGFDLAIRDARDAVGHALAHAMQTVEPRGLTFDEVAARFIEGLLAEGCGAVLHAVLDHFLWRGIDPRPFLTFVPAPHPGGLPRPDRRRAELFAVVPTPLRAHCPGCDPGGTLRATRLIRVGHHRRADR